MCLDKTWSNDNTPSRCPARKEQETPVGSEDGKSWKYDTVFFYICNELYELRYFLRGTIAVNIISSRHAALADHASAREQITLVKVSEGTRSSVGHQKHPRSGLCQSSF